MTTTKYRIPVSLTTKQKQIFESIGVVHETSLAKIIIHFAQYGLENAEDDYLGEFADSLDENVTGFQNHEEFWQEIKS